MPRRIGHWIQLKAIALVACPCIATAAGCASLGRPDWLDPGPIRNQRRTAVRFDPFMQNDIGPSAARLRRAAARGDPIPLVVAAGAMTRPRV